MVASQPRESASIKDVQATILVVEDNPITSKLVRFTLEHDGFSVIGATNAADAVELFASGSPNLVLLDLLLPDIDGFELLRRLRSMERGREVPILAFTGLLSPYDEGRLSEFGFSTTSLQSRLSRHGSFKS